MTLVLDIGSHLMLPSAKASVKYNGFMFQTSTFPKEQIRTNMPGLIQYALFKCWILRIVAEHPCPLINSNQLFLNGRNSRLFVKKDKNKNTKTPLLVFPEEFTKQRQYPTQYVFYNNIGKMFSFQTDFFNFICCTTLIKLNPFPPIQRL